MTVTASPRVVTSQRCDAVLDVLERLDRVLEHAVARAEAVYGVSPGQDPHRGLYVSAPDARRLLLRDPVTPLFALPAAGMGSPLGELKARFGLSTFELNVVVLALAPELDLRYERVYAYLQDDVTRRRPTVGLALDLLCRAPSEKLAARAHFASDAPLLAHRLLRLTHEPLQPEPVLLAHALVLDQQVVRMLIGVAGGDPRLAGVAQLLPPDGGPTSEPERALATLAIGARAANRPLVLSLEGRPRSGRRRAALALAREVSQRLLLIDLGRVRDREDFDELVPLAFAEARIRHAIPFVCGLERLPVDGAPLAACLRDQRAVAIVASSERPDWLSPEAVSVSFGPLPFQSRLERWRDVAAEREARATVAELEQLAARFRLTAGQIEDAAGAAEARARLRAAQSQADCRPNVSDLYAGARGQSAPRLRQLATRYEPRRGFDDLVLPADQLKQLHDVVNEAAHHHVVYGDWGFARKLSSGTGLSVLFSGPPGTGKTLAAEVIAYELGLDLYRIDLSQIVSKYIGETERNLAEIFREAATASAILLFDEADALFGKRAEVRDAHDRYANVEIAYLLAKMEEHEGVVILSTNLRHHIDQAFLRRLRHVVEFPNPDEIRRRRIWEVTFPDEAPLGADLDLDLLAREIELPGGNIKNITLAAAFVAAADGGTIHLEHIEGATRREFSKLGYAWTGLRQTSWRQS